jgi:hypothetical protein
MKLSALLVIAGLAMLAGSAGLRLTTQSAQAQTATTFAIDADPSTVAIDSSRSVPSGATFSIDVVLTDHTAAYGSYQISIDYDDVRFIAIGLPSNWNTPPVLDVSAGTPSGTVIWSSGVAFCDPSPGANALQGEDDSGTANVTITCAAGDVFDTSNYQGMLAEFVLQCQTDSVGTISIRGVSDNFISDAAFTPLNDGTTGATVTCGSGAAPTDTPTGTSTPTVTFNTPIPNTPVPSNTPTKTPTSTRTAPPDQVQITPTPRSGQTGGGTPAPGGPGPGGPGTGGGPGGVIRGPNTGTGDSASGGVPYVMILLGGGMVFIGLGLAPFARRAIAQVQRTRGG